MFKQLAIAIKMEVGFAHIKSVDPKAFASRDRDHFALWYSRLPQNVQ